MLPTKFPFIWPSSFRGEEFKQIYQCKPSIACGACLLTDWHEMCNLYTGLSIDASYQVSFHLTKWLQRRRFLEID